MKITVIGFGSWGGTIAQHLTTLNHNVTGWHKFPEEVEEMQQTRQHILIPQLQISKELQLTTDLEPALKDAEIVVIATPSHIVRGIISESVKYIKDDAIIVNLAKGVEIDSLQTMSQVIAEAGDISKNRIVTLYGPSHAEEVALGMPTTLVSACENTGTAKIVQHEFSSEKLRIYTNKDILGVELAGSLKNVIAIAAGICDGIGYGDNTKAALITRGLSEMTRLGVEMGAKPETFFGLSGIGDLMATCLSKHSRNRYVGEELGKGRKLEEILDDMKMVAEGVKTAKSVVQLRDKYNVPMPIASAMESVLFHGEDPIDKVKELMTRDLKKEKAY
ncbi:MAG: NAD(P)H-dependent glycerol-3-phosphate dehydrogenase [Candidatus Neomarinimicrobiota bacterium]